jgi:hypothetical protein
MSIAQAGPVVAVAGPALTEIVNFATTVAARCIEAARPEPHVDVAPLVLFLHAIEMTDGLQILISQSATGPALVTARSLLGATLFPRDQERPRVAKPASGRGHR